MAKEFRYTTLANRYTARFPVLTYVGTQINFWILANLLLAVIITYHSRVISVGYGLQITLNFWAVALLAIFLGLLYGIILGIAGYYVDGRMLRQQNLGVILVLKIVLSVSMLVAILFLLRNLLLLQPFKSSLHLTGMKVEEESWRALFYLLVTYYFSMTVVISFVNQVNKKYGPGILLPLLLGRYRTPREEQRIFMFMDLKSSTTTAEQLGHLKYSAFIRDCFGDINEVLYPYRAQVYQYVGDEIVLTWPEAEGIRDYHCIRFFFACRKQFSNRFEYYMSNYGLMPSFKAGVHTGIVSAVEIGEYKRDIAYHGDTLNTASRLQSLCNELGKDLIASKPLLDKAGVHPGMRTHSLGPVFLKGKSVPVELFSIEDFQD